MLFDFREFPREAEVIWLGLLLWEAE